MEPKTNRAKYGAAAFERRSDARADRLERQNAALKGKLARKREDSGQIDHVRSLAPTSVHPRSG